MMINEADQKVIRQLFDERLTAPVQIDFFTRSKTALILPGERDEDDCPTCALTGELLGEVATLSERIALVTHDLRTDPAAGEPFGVDRTPAFVLSGAARGRVRGFGIPSGYEFSGLIEDLIDVASGTTGLTPETRTGLATLTKPLHLQVYVTPT
jgi:alkyl hydroperoxide reductase subunit AhpF